MQDFALVKNGKVQRRGRINLIGRLQLSTEKTREEENQGILQLRILRTQEAIIKILKMRKRISNAQLQVSISMKMLFQYLHKSIFRLNWWTYLRISSFQARN